MKRILLFCFIFFQYLLAMPQVQEIIRPIGKESLGNVPSGAFILHDGWQLHSSAIVGNDAAAISSPGFDATAWFSTSVPTTVLSCLVRKGVYPDPYIGMNNMLIPDASDDHNKRFDLAKYSHLPDKSNPWSKPWWFRRQFEVPVDYSGKTVWLHLDGINYRADIWLNGKKVAESKKTVGMFRRFHYDVSSLLNLDGPNILAVCIHPLDFPGNPCHEQLDGMKGEMGPNGGDGEILRNVTQYCAVGWDWIPPARDRNMGIWQHVWLAATGAVVVRDPAAFTNVQLPDCKEAKVTIRYHLQNATPAPVSAEVIARIEPIGFEGSKIEVRQQVQVEAGEPKEFSFKPEMFPELTMKNPRIWWPVTYGDQPLYRLTVESRVEGKLTSTSVRRFGVRSVGSHILPSGGRVFSVNGRTIRMSGGAWVPDFLLNWDAQRYRDEVRLMAEGNQTIVRVNGCGIVAPDCFFNACDSLGLLVWQDLSRTSFTHAFRKDGIYNWNPPEVDPAYYLDNMHDCIIRLRGCTSMLLWCGCNEALPDGNTGAILQNKMLPDLDGTRPWIPSSSSEPAWSKEPVATWTGGPWRMIRLPEYFDRYAKDRQFTSRNEIGLASMLPINSVAQSMPDYDQPEPAIFPLNKTMGYHDAIGGNYRPTDQILREDIGDPATLSDYLKMGDLYNEQAYRAIFEAANKARPLNSGTHLWKVNAAWPGFMWQVFDWYLRPNAGYYSMRSALKPLHVQFSADDFTIQVVSTLAEAKNGLKVHAKIIDLKGKTVAEANHKVVVGPDQTVSIGALPEAVKEGKTYIVSLDLLDQQGKLLDHTATWAGKDTKWKGLLTAPIATVKARVMGQSENSGETTYLVRVVNTSPVPAIQVWLEAIRGQQGGEILPSFWTDNAFTLLPGEQREMKVSFRKSEMKGSEPHLMLEGWNVNPKEVSVKKNANISISLKLSNLTLSTYGKNLTFTAEQSGATGTRLTTWPIALSIDGEFKRLIHINTKGGNKSRITIPVSSLGGFPSGAKNLSLGGEQTISCSLK